MGTWDAGPFGNDTAADWCGAFHDAGPPERIALLRSTFAEIAADGNVEDCYYSERAVAAAAVLVSQLPGGRPLTSSYAPDFLLAGGRFDVPPDLPASALGALDLVVSDDSEWRELWATTDELDVALASVEELRGPLREAAST